MFAFIHANRMITNQAQRRRLICDRIPAGKRDERIEAYRTGKKVPFMEKASFTEPLQLCEYFEMAIRVQSRQTTETLEGGYPIK